MTRLDAKKLIAALAMIAPAYTAHAQNNANTYGSGAETNSNKFGTDKGATTQPDSAANPNSATNPSSMTNPSPMDGHSEVSLDRNKIMEAQQGLKDRGYSVTADGVAGPKTMDAVRRFQQTQGLSETGQLDSRTLEALRASPDVERAPASVPDRDATNDAAPAADINVDTGTGSKTNHQDSTAP